MRLRFLSYFLLLLFTGVLVALLIFVYRTRLPSRGGIPMHSAVVMVQASHPKPDAGTTLSGAQPRLHVVAGTPVEIQPPPPPRYTYRNEFPLDRSKLLPLYLIDTQTGQETRLGNDSGAALFGTQDDNYLIWQFFCESACIALQDGFYAHVLATGQELFIAGPSAVNVQPKIAGEWVAHAKVDQPKTRKGDLFVTSLKTHETLTLTHDLLWNRPGRSDYFGIGGKLITWLNVTPRTAPNELVIYDLTTRTTLAKLNTEEALAPNVTVYHLAAGDTVVTWSRNYGYDTVTGAYFTVTLAPPNWTQPVFDVSPVTEKDRILSWTMQTTDGILHAFKAPLLDATPSAAPCIEGQNLVQNGDLEDIGAHNLWQQSGSPSDLIINDLPANAPQAGHWAIRLGRYANAQPTIQQTVNIPSNVKHITLAFDVRASSWDIWGGDQLQVDLIDPVTNQSILVTPVAWTNRQLANGGWMPLQVDIQDWPGIDTPLYLVFRATTDWAFPTDFTLDNIRFVTACQ